MDDVADLIEGSFTSYLCTTTGSANAYIAAPSPALGALTSGARLWIITNFTNTGATTINVSSLGAKAVVDLANNALVGGEMISGELYSLIYDGTSWRLLNGRPAWKTWTPTWSCSGSLTFTPSSRVFERYNADGKLLRGVVETIGTLGGTASNIVKFTSPASIAGTADRLAGSAFIVDGGAHKPGYAIASGSTNTISIMKEDASTNYANSGTCYIRCVFCVEAA